MAQITVFYGMTNEEFDRMSKKIEKDILSKKAKTHEKQDKPTVQEHRTDENQEREACKTKNVSNVSKREVSQVPYPCALIEMKNLSKRIMEADEPNDVKRYVLELRELSTSPVITKLCNEFLVGDALRVEIRDEVESIFSAWSLRSDLMKIARKYGKQIDVEQALKCFTV